jgi:hypothetical protein
VEAAGIEPASASASSVRLYERSFRFRFAYLSVPVSHSNLQPVRSYFPGDRLRAMRCTPRAPHDDGGLFTSFHEKAHSVKADVAARRGRVQRLCPSPCFHPHFREPLIFGGSVHYEIRLFGLLLTRRCNLPIGLSPP